jgi:hypothetical protein
MDPKAGRADVEKRKFFNLIWDSNFDPSVVQSVASRYTDCAIPIRQQGKFWNNNNNKDIYCFC